MKFSLLNCLASCAVLLFSINRVAFAQSSIEQTAQFLCTQIFNTGEYRYESSFSDSFRKAISEATFREIVKESQDAAGPCVNTLKLTNTETAAEYRLQSSEGNSIRIIFSIDSSARIMGFRILDVNLDSQKIRGWDDAVAVLNSWDGRTSLSIAEFGKTSKSLRGKEVQPLGSVFKLYVLGALVDSVSTGKLTWQDQYPLRDEHKSLPSGVMHTWPAGKMISLYQFAENMIKISDNTATDHLIDIVGRNTVEDQLGTLNNSFPEMNIPFLTTVELFKLKWAVPSEFVHTYLNRTSAGRRTMLEENISQISLNQVGSNGVSMSSPAFTREIEWFASTQDICSALQGLNKKNSEETFKILSQNVPLVDSTPTSHWQYAGFKGGSEPGVLAASYLLKSKSGAAGCVAVTWNNTLKNVNEWKFFDAVGKILKLAEQSIP